MSYVGHTTFRRISICPYWWNINILHSMLLSWLKQTHLLTCVSYVRHDENKQFSLTLLVGKPQCIMGDFLRGQAEKINWHGVGASKKGRIETNHAITTRMCTKHCSQWRSKTMNQRDYIWPSSPWPVNPFLRTFKYTLCCTHSTSMDVPKAEIRAALSSRASKTKGFLKYCNWAI